MKIKLNVFGDLFIERKKTMKPQFCPYQWIIYEEGRPEMTPCGEWCPLFNIEYDEKSNNVMVTLCNSFYEIDKEDLIDERELT